MSLNLRRTEKALKSLGFQKLRREAKSSTIYFVRDCNIPHLFEWVYLAFAGSANEAVFAYVGISVIGKGALVKGLIETKVLVEIASEKTRGWTEIQNDVESLDWERRLAGCIPEAIERQKRDFADSLLQKTERARNAVQGYFAKLEHILGNQDIRSWYSQQPQENLKALAKEVSLLPGVCNLATGYWLYEIAVFLVLLWGSDLEAHKYVFDPLTPFSTLDRELIWRLELLVDRLIFREGSVT